MSNIYSERFRGRGTKRELPFMGTLFVRYDFTVYRSNRYGTKKKGYVIDANDTSDNVLRDSKRMHKNALSDAKSQLFYIVGGSPKYTVKIVDYAYKYRETIPQGARSKTRDVNYYENELPDTDRTYKEPPQKTRTTNKSTKPQPKSNKKVVTKKKNVSKMKQKTKKNVTTRK